MLISSQNRNLPLWPFYRVALIGLFLLLSSPYLLAAVPLSQCAQCHGTRGEGISMQPLLPVLAAQQENYLLQRLNYFQQQAKQGSNAVIANVVANLQQQERQALANYFASQKPVLAFSQSTNLMVGRNLYLGGNLRYHIPACAACHSPTGLGNNPAAIPRLAGQRPDYIAQQLKAFRRDERISNHQGVMNDIAKKLNDEEIQAIANYLAGLY